MGYTNFFKFTNKYFFILQTVFAFVTNSVFKYCMAFSQYTLNNLSGKSVTAGTHIRKKILKAVHMLKIFQLRLDI